MTRGRAMAVARTVAVLVALQALAIGLYVAVDRGRRPSKRVGVQARALTSRPAPALEVEHAGGAVATLAALRGRVVLVHFWATWCPPCRRELPTLLAVAAELRRAGDFDLLAVSVDDDWPALAAYFHGEIPAAIVRARVEGIHLQYGASTLPDSYLVDRAGNLVQRFSGEQDWRDPALRAVLEDLLREPERRR